jgi:hypothetical protein
MGALIRDWRITPIDYSIEPLNGLQIYRVTWYDDQGIECDYELLRGTVISAVEHCDEKQRKLYIKLLEYMDSLEES